MRAAMATAALLACLLALSASPAAGQSCTDLGQSLRSACGNVVDAVNQNADAIVSATCQGLRNAVTNAANSGVSPSSGCCSAARSFIGQGCSCDANVNNLAVSLLGFNQNTLKASAFIAQVSVCGAICNPCGNGPCGCGGAAPS